MNDPQELLQAGENLVATHAYGTPAFTRGLDMLRQAATGGSVEAQVVLGHVHAQVHLLPDAGAQAAYWYRLAAEQGHPMAQDRLADLYMTGRGLSQDDAEALRWYTRTAEQAYAQAQCNLAYMHAEGIGTVVDEVSASDWYLRAAAQGEARAYFNLGLRYQSGRGLPADPVCAWACLSNAARLGYPTSESELANLGAALDSADLARAETLAARLAENFESLQKALGRNPQALESAELYRQMVEENFAKLGVAAFSLDAMSRSVVAGPGVSTLSGPHRTAKVIEESVRPRIFTVNEFISKEESAHLMMLAGLHFQTAREHTRDKLSQEHVAFNGQAATFHSALCDAVTRNIERRIAAAFQLPARHVEPLSVLRYEPGHAYAPHVDYFDTVRLEQNRKLGDRSGQRIASFLVYLRAPEAGGETAYLQLGRKFAGRDRMALCHFNCLPDRTPDPMTLHTGSPVIRGEKWLARTTLREEPFY